MVNLGHLGENLYERRTWPVFTKVECSKMRLLWLLPLYRRDSSRRDSKMFFFRSFKVNVVDQHRVHMFIVFSKALLEIEMQLWNTNLVYLLRVLGNEKKNQINSKHYEVKKKLWKWFPIAHSWLSKWNVFIGMFIRFFFYLQLDRVYLIVALCSEACSNCLFGQ